MSSEGIYRLIGLAQKAGKVASGGFLVEQAVKAKQAHLVIIASDASAASRKQYQDKADFRQVSCRVWGTKMALGHAIGQSERSGIALLDKGFANAIVQKIDLERSPQARGEGE